MWSARSTQHCQKVYVVWSNTGRSDDDDDDDDNDDDENNDVCSSVPSTIADISLYYHWKFGHDLWLDFYALNNLIWADHR